MLEELVTRVADYDIDAGGARRVHSINVRGFACLPTTVVSAPDGGRTAPDAGLSEDRDHGEIEIRRPRGTPYLVVTGASSGIGAAVAVALAGAGHPVVLGARRVEKCDEVASVIRAAGGEAHVHRSTSPRPPRSRNSPAPPRTRWAPIDIMVSSAGHAEPGTALATSPKAFAHTVEVNLLGAHRLVAALAPAMAQRHHGDLVSSAPTSSAPPAAHGRVHGVEVGARGPGAGIAARARGSGVRATIIQPGQTLSEMGTEWGPETTTEVLGEWLGSARPDTVTSSRPPAVAAAVLAAVTTPPGTDSPDRGPAEAPIAADTGGTP